jgi:hypothetical protein
LYRKGNIKIYFFIERIEYDRSAAIDACIIRVMKQSKKENHYELIKKVNDFLKDYFMIRIDVYKF